MNCNGSMFFTFFYESLFQYGKIAPEFAMTQIKSYILNLKENHNLFDNLVRLEGDLLLKMSMTYPQILKECLALGLGEYSNVIDLINWALFCGPTAPSSMVSFTPSLRIQALHHVLDHKDNLLFLSYHFELLHILQYLPTDKSLTRKFIDKFPQFPITNEWLLSYLHRGNPSNIPYIVSHRNNREILYQEPNFITKMLPSLRNQMEEDDSFIGPNENRNQYYHKLRNFHSLIEEARPLVVRENINVLFWTTILVIRVRNFLQRYYAPSTGKGYLKQMNMWEEHKQTYRIIK